MQATGGVEVQQAKPRFAPPDLLTILRIPLAVAFVAIDDGVIRLAILGVVSVTDIADGIWARRVGGSRAGAVLDPVADKLFMLAAFFVVFRSGVLTTLEIVGVLLRDILAAISFFATVVLGKTTTLPARAGGKALTVCQALTLIAFLAQSELVRPLAWATAAVSLYSIADYTRAFVTKKST